MLKVLLALAALPALAATADAAVVQVAGGSGQRALTIASFGPAGQSFTATDANLLSFGFQLETLNGTAANDALTFTLRAGSGVGGTVVATRTVTPSGIPATRTPTWLDVDLAGTTLVAGQTYTALLSATSSRLGLIYGPDVNLISGAPTGGDAYAAGRLVATGFSDAVCDGGICDANFRFNAVSAVPEPATWATMIGGFALLGGVWRRRSTRAAAGADHLPTQARGPSAG